MTDYKNLKLIATSSPHIRAAENTRSIMLDVIIAMMPALIWAIVKFGFRALTLTAVSVVGCMFFEWGYRKLMKKPQSVNDLSAAVTGILLAFVCPVNMPYWMILVGDFFAIVVVKQLFGGLGQNFMNPALGGRAFLMMSYPVAMTTWVLPGKWAGIVGANVDGITGATPLSNDFMHSGLLPSGVTVKDMFVGNIGGCLGEISALMLIIGGVYLIWRGTIRARVPVAFIGTVAVLTFLFPKGGADNLQFMLYSIFGGGLMLGAFFMATDYTTSPVTKTGQLIFGLGCGLLTVFIRYFGSYPEGVCYSIMIMNLVVALIDKAVKPSRFGVVKSANKEAAAK